MRDKIKRLLRENLINERLTDVDSDVDSDVIEITEVDALFSKINKFYILKN